MQLYNNTNNKDRTYCMWFSRKTEKKETDMGKW